MWEAIEEAKESQSEDQRPHPKVGAILADETARFCTAPIEERRKVGGTQNFIFCIKRQRMEST